MEYTIKMQRENSIRNAYFSLLREMKTTCPLVTTEDVIEAMMSLPAPRFYTSLSTAQRIISRMYRGLQVRFSNKNKESMYNEILSRTKEALKRGEIKNYVDIEKIIEQQAPSYYVTPVTMKTVVYQSIKNAKKFKN